MPAGVLALAVGLTFATLVYSFVIRPLRAAPPVTMLVATVGVSLVLQALAVKNFGDRTLRSPALLPQDVITVFGRQIPVDRLWLVAVVMVLAFVVQVTYRATRFGLATRAAFLDEKGAVLLGLEPARLGWYNWMFASTVAAVAGIIGSSLGGVSPFSFALFVVPALGAALAAQLRSIPIAVATALGIGAFESIEVHLVAQRQVPRFFHGGISSLVPFVLIILALILVGRRLPDRATILVKAHVPAPPAGVHRLGWGAAIGLGIIVVGSGDPVVRFAGMQTMVVATLLMSMVVLTGFVGQVSLAQLSFAGFTAFMLSRLDVLPFPVGPLLAIAITTAVGTLVSIPALRVRGIQFAVVTLAIAVLFDEMLFRSPTFVGRGGLAQVASPKLFGIELGIAGGGAFPQRRFGFVLLVVTVMCALLIVGVRNSSLGRRFLAVRANERAAAAAGINVAATKITGAALSSFIAGVAGVMIAYKSTTLTGAGLDAQEGLELLALAYLGGIGSLGGALIGGLLAPSGLVVVVILGGGSSIDQFLLTGAGLVLATVRYPGGLAGLLAGTLRRFRDRDGVRDGAEPDVVEMWFLDE